MRFPGGQLGVVCLGSGRPCGRCIGAVRCSSFAPLRAHAARWPVEFNTSRLATVYWFTTERNGGSELRGRVGSAGGSSGRGDEVRGRRVRTDALQVRKRATPHSANAGCEMTSEGRSIQSNWNQGCNALVRGARGRILSPALTVGAYALLRTWRASARTLPPRGTAALPTPSCRTNSPPKLRSLITLSGDPAHGRMSAVSGRQRSTRRMRPQ